MTPFETGSTTTPGALRATAPPVRTFGPHGPTLGDLIDAYLQDYQVRQFRSHSTARGRIGHLTAFFGRDARADALTTPTRSASTNAPGAPPGPPPAPSTARPRRSTAWARSPSTGAGSTPCPASPTGSARILPTRVSSSTLNTSPSAPTCPPRGRTSSMWPTYSGWRKQEILGLTWEEIDAAGGVIRLSPARSKTLVGRILPISQPIADALNRRRARRDPASPLVFHRDGIPVRRWRTAWRTACQAAGVPTRFLHDCRRTAARNLIRASVPERVAMLLTGHKSRAIFDRYNIINEQELLEAGDQLVAYLAQRTQAVPARRRPHPANSAAPRTASPLRLVRRGRTQARARQAPPAASRAKAGRPTRDHRLSRHPWLAPLRWRHCRPPRMCT